MVARGFGQRAAVDSFEASPPCPSVVSIHSHAALVSGTEYMPFRCREGVFFQSEIRISSCASPTGECRCPVMWLSRVAAYVI